MPITYINESFPTNKTLLVRVDFNVPLTPNRLITDPTRIMQVLPTLQALQKTNNKLILLAHLGRPEKRDEELSLRPIFTFLKTLFPSDAVTFAETIEDLKELSSPLTLLENIRFYPEETKNDQEFAKNLARLGDAYVNDAFSADHRNDASVVGIPRFLPSYGGLLLKKELSMLSTIVTNPEKPFVAVMGGNKISTKVELLKQFLDHATTILVGGGIANILLLAKGVSIGTSVYEETALSLAKEIIFEAEKRKTNLILPVDAVVGMDKDGSQFQSVAIHDIPNDMGIFDLGLKTQALFANELRSAKTVVWNGPLGYTENPLLRTGTTALFHTLTQLTNATTILGGGDTLSSIHDLPGQEKISHISTGGGAMLTFLESGTLPGITALENSPKEKLV